MQAMSAKERSATEVPDAEFGANDVRLSPREWGLAVAIMAAFVWLVPVAWQKFEPLKLGVDHRMPYSLGNDYWLYSRVARTACAEGRTPVIGDSVVWGHYVSGDQTLTHYLNELAGEDRFANLGVDGIHPAAMAGLMAYYGRAISNRNVVLHCNLLWISSARQDLQTRKEFSFNHPDLVPQFVPKIPCYRRPVSERLGTVIGRRLPFIAWARHVRVAYFAGSDLPSWTFEHPYEDPLRQITLECRSPDEPPSPKPTAEPWTEKGIAKFDARWVELGTSIQWLSLRRTLDILQRRRNRVVVLLGPLNEHMLTQRSLAVYRQRRAAVEVWLKQEGIPYAAPAALPSEQYADASHPLSEGYAFLARQLFGDEAFSSLCVPTAGEDKPE